MQTIEQPVGQQQNADTKQANEPKINNKPGDGTKWTDVAGLIVNIVLAGFTYLLFTKTVEANLISGDSLKQATRANDHNEYKDSLNKIEDDLRNNAQAKKDSITQIRDSFNLAIAKQSLNAQIGTINETQKQFRIQNEPFLQIANPTIVYDSNNNSVVIVYSVINIKDAPVNIKNIKGINYIGDDKPSIDDLHKRSKSNATLLNQYLVKGMLFERYSTTHLSEGNVSFDYLEKPTNYIFFYNEIEYTNLTTGEERICKYCAKMKLVNNNRTYYEVLINENTNIHH